MTQFNISQTKYLWREVRKNQWHSRCAYFQFSSNNLLMPFWWLPDVAARGLDNWRIRWRLMGTVELYQMALTYIGLDELGKQWSSLDFLNLSYKLLRNVSVYSIRRFVLTLISRMAKNFLSKHKTNANLGGAPIVNHSVSMGGKKEPTSRPTLWSYMGLSQLSISITIWRIYRVKISWWHDFLIRLFI